MQKTSAPVVSLLTAQGHKQVVRNIQKNNEFSHQGTLWKLQTPVAGVACSVAGAVQQ